MKLRKVSPALLPFVEDVCQRDGIPISEKKYEEERCWISVPVGSRRFTELIVDAKCEKQRFESDGIPVLSYRTVRNTKKRRRILEANGTNAFHILREDAAKYQRIS